MKETRWKDFFGNEVSREKAEASGQYSIETFEEEAIKKIEYIENGMLEITHYHLNASEYIPELLPLYKDEKVSFSTTTYINSYKIEEILLYEKGRLKERAKWVINSRNQYICLQKIDVVTGKVIHQATEKYYKDETSDYTFEYDQSGHCFMIHRGTEDDIFAWEIGKPQCSFTWKGFEYYQNSEPLFPEIEDHD